MFYGNKLRFPGVQGNPPRSKEEEGVWVTNTPTNPSAAAAPH